MAFQIGKKADIDKIPTKVLKAGWRQREYDENSDTSYSGVGLVPTDPVVIDFEHKRYTIGRGELKAILATREHVPNKQESKLIRQQKAKHGNSN